MRTHDIHTHVNSTKRAVYVRFCIVLKCVCYAYLYATNMLPLCYYFVTQEKRVTKYCIVIM